MSDVMCRYSGDREQAIVGFVYGESEPDERAQFDAHLPSCARCRTEVSALTGVRAQLGRWAPPEPVGLIAGHHALATSLEPPAASHQPSAAGHRSWWPELPAWAQVAAAVLLLGVSAGVANLDVRHDANGWRLRTGWSKPVEAMTPVASAVAATSPAPTHAELTALEERLRTEIARVKEPANANLANVANPGNPGSADVLRRVRALVDESERHQQRELALRVAELLRDVNSQRQTDLVQIQRSLGVIQSNTGVEMMRQRETLNNILVRTSLQK